MEFPYLVKTVVQDGNGYQWPKDGDMVIFHKTIMTTEDEIIVSSIKNLGGCGAYRLPMDAELMPAGLFTALSTMEINEVSWFVIDSRTGPNFGQQNSSEESLAQLTSSASEVPPDDTRGGGKCQLHLLAILPDPHVLEVENKIVKSIIVKGNFDGPKLHDTVQIRYTAQKLNGEILFKERQETLFLKKSSEGSLGLKTGLLTMKWGEAAVLYVHSDFVSLQLREEFNFEEDLKFIIYPPIQPAKAEPTIAASYFPVEGFFSHRRTLTSAFSHRRTLTSVFFLQRTLTSAFRKKNKPGKENQPQQTGKEKQAGGGKGKQTQIENLDKPGKKEQQPKLLADAIRGRKGKQAQIEDLDKPGKEQQPKLLADAIKAQQTGKEKQAAGGKGMEKQTAAFEDLEKAQTRKARSRPIWTQWFHAWLDMSWIGWIISIMRWFKRVSGWVSGWFKRFKRVIGNRIFIKAIQFIVVGGIILGDKVRFVDKTTYPVKYRVLIFSGIFSLVFGFVLSIFFPRVGANFLDFISYVEIWIGGLGYLA